MNFNGVTEYLCRHCDRMVVRYWEQDQKRQKTGQSLLYIKRLFYGEMSHKLSMLVDWETDAFAEYLMGVKTMVPVRKAYSLGKEQRPEALALLREAEEEFSAFLEGVTERDTLVTERYLRTITGEEKERLEYAILERWDYDPAHHWYPLVGSFDESKLFLNSDRVEPYLDRLCAMLGLPEKRVYEYGEGYFDGGTCCEVDDLYGYGGNEVAYLPNDLSWIIYCSHEFTVTFAGTIVPMVKELLANEREHWNKWD